MSKDDYTSNSIKNEYKSIITKPSTDLPTITVANDEKRTRADLLDILEELFDSEKVGETDNLQEEQLQVNTKNFRALLHILIKSSANSSDDSLLSLSTANHTLNISVVNSRGSYSLVFTVVDSSGRNPVTKTATLALR